MCFAHSTVCPRASYLLHSLFSPQTGALPLLSSPFPGEQVQIRVLLMSLQGGHLKLSLGPGPWVRAVCGSCTSLRGQGSPASKCLVARCTDTWTLVGPTSHNLHCCPYLRFLSRWQRHCFGYRKFCKISQRQDPTTVALSSAWGPCPCN